MKNKDLRENIKEMGEFLEKFVLFHLGRDAEVEFRALPEEKLDCSISHIRIEDIRFELDSSLIERFSRDIPAFEDYLLELLTRNRRSLAT